MIWTSRLQKGIDTAANLHKNQQRKSSGLPYIVHLVGVLLILIDYTRDEDILIAGLLHDVLEDVAGYSEQDMRKDFGDKVTNLVLAVSEDKDPNEKGSTKPWKVRKMGYLNALQSHSSDELLIAAADKIHNMESTIAEKKERGEVVWEKFKSSPEEQQWFNREVFTILKERLDNKIVKRYEETLDRADEVLYK